MRLGRGRNEYTGRMTEESTAERPSDPGMYSRRQDIKI
jgi:hypothetical protein